MNARLGLAPKEGGAGRGWVGSERTAVVGVAVPVAVELVDERTVGRGVVPPRLGWDASNALNE